MSAKIAKRIRKEIGYYPRQVRKYKNTGRGVELDEKCTRSLYQLLKDEAKSKRGRI